MTKTLLYFRCHECSSSAYIKEYDDPTTATGSCKTCGSSNWSLYLTSLTAAEYFKFKLAGKTLFPRSYIQERIA